MPITSSRRRTSSSRTARPSAWSAGRSKAATRRRRSQPRSPASSRRQIWAGLPATDPDILASLPVVDATIASPKPSGVGFHRYNGDGYGDRASGGRPWAPSGQGTGHLWPALSAERGEQALATGDAGGASSLLA